MGSHGFSAGRSIMLGVDWPQDWPKICANPETGNDSLRLVFVMVTREPHLSMR